MCSKYFDERPFQIHKWQISLPFHILRLVKSLPFHIPEAWKRCPFRAEPPRIGHYRKYPPPPGDFSSAFTETETSEAPTVDLWLWTNFADLWTKFVLFLKRRFKKLHFIYHIVGRELKLIKSKWMYPISSSAWWILMTKQKMRHPLFCRQNYFHRF